MMSRLDANEYALNQYLHKIDGEHARDIAIEQETESILQDILRKLSPDNVSEALGEMSMDDVKLLTEQIKSSKKDHVEISKLMERVVIGYWQGYAKKQAEESVDNREDDFDEPEQDYD
jgi:Mg/Co/Ni transporter MgtE